MDYQQGRVLASSFFRDGQLNQRFGEELKVINRKWGLKIKVEDKKLTLHVEIEVQGHFTERRTASFMITVTKYYPLKAPRLYLMSELVFPKVNDYRDVLEDVIESRWTYQHTILYICSRLEGFCTGLSKLDGMPLKLQRLGKFYPGEKIFSQFIDEFPIEKYNVQERTKQKNQRKVLTISSLHIMVWNNISHELTLEFAGPIQSINELYNSRQGEMIVKFKCYKNLKEFTVLTKRLIFKDSEQQGQFTRMVLKTITSLQTVKINFQGNKSCKDNELLQKQIKSIQTKEQEYLRHPLNSVVGSSLNKLYQKMIDYYSLRGDYLYIVYVHKLNTLCRLMKA